MVSVTSLLSWLILTCFVTVCLSNPKWNRMKRVRAAEDALPHSKPWMVHIGCGSFLINRKPHLFSTDIREGSSDILLTAAHCIVHDSHDPAFNIQRPQIIASLGRHNLADLNEPHQIQIPVAKAMIHEQYHPSYDSKLKYDIAIIQLEKPVEFNKHIQPIALSNFTLDDVNNCSLSGWGGSKNRALKTTFITDLVDRGVYYSAKPDLNASIYFLIHSKSILVYANETPGSKYDILCASTNIIICNLSFSGDSGSPMVCIKDNKVVAQGIMSNSEGPHDNWHTDNFVDIVECLPWILETLDKIDDPYFYHHQLLPYRSFPADNAVTIEILKFYSVGAAFSLDDFERKLNFKVAADYDQRWLNRTFYRQFHVKCGKFYIAGIFGYEIVADALTCAVLCYDKNRAGICSYVQAGKRCYFSDEGIYKPSWAVSIDVRQSVVIYFQEKYELKYTEQSDEVMQPNAPLDIQSMQPTWNISIMLMDGPFHCTGRMSSSDTPNMEVASSCINAVNRKSDEVIFGTQVTMLSNNKMQETTIWFEIELINEMTEAVFMYFFGFSFNDGYPEMNIPVTKHPVLREYEPSSGAFMIKPRTAPWIVYLQHWRRGDHCGGALLNESSITRIGRTDRTRFLLSTLSCFKERIHLRRNPTVIAGRYFFDLNGYHEQMKKVRKLHDRPYYDQLNASLADWPIIVEMKDDIVFNSYVQPLDLVMNRSISMDDWSLATVGWIRGKYYGPQYAIPLRANQSNLRNDANIKLDEVSTIITERLYRINNDVINQRHARGNPLIICHNINKSCGLLGFYLQSPSSDSNNTEEYFTLNSYLGWIENVLNESLSNLL